MQQRGSLALWSFAEVLADRDIPANYRDAFRTVSTWSREFLTNADPALGRDGAVCPFAKASIDRDTFLFTHLESSVQHESLSTAISAYGEWFTELLAACAERDRQYLTMILVLDANSQGDAIDAIQQALKDRFVRNGLMLGQFHPTCEEPGLWNDSFRPLRSPVPLFAIRLMTRFDMPFLMQTSAQLDSYLAQFAPGIPPYLRARLADAAAPSTAADTRIE
jgi:hypothetical protein